MEKVRRVSAGTLLTIGGGINIVAFAGMVYQAGQMSERLENVQSRSSVHEAAIMSTRQNLDDKVDRIKADVGEIKAQLSAIQGELKRLK